MEYVRYKPGPPLDAFVEYLWSLSDAPSHAKELIVPSATLELVVNLVEDEIRVYGTPNAAMADRYEGAVLSGAFDRPFVVDTQEHASIVGVHFTPRHPKEARNAERRATTTQDTQRSRLGAVADPRLDECEISGRKRAVRLGILVPEQKSPPSLAGSHQLHGEGASSA